MLLADCIIPDFFCFMHFPGFYDEFIQSHALFCKFRGKQIGYVFSHNVGFGIAGECFKILVCHDVAGLRILKHHEAWQIIHDAAQLLFAQPQCRGAGSGRFQGFLSL